MFAKVALLVGGVIIQETVTLNALLFLTHHGMYPPLLIHFSFFTATIIDMIIGFRIGKYLHKRTHATKLATYIQKLSN